MIPKPRFVGYSVSKGIPRLRLSATYRRLVREGQGGEPEATHDPEAFMAVQRQLALRSLADPTPPHWSQWWFGSHPPALERIALAVGLGVGRRAAGERDPALFPHALEALHPGAGGWASRASGISRRSFCAKLRRHTSLVPSGPAT
mgnify:CR=1 FL=1